MHPQPATFSRRILLSVTGLSPQVVTETLYALADGVGFVARVAGASSLLPQTGLLRFGGDGHAARVRAADCEVPTIAAATLASEGRFRLLLTSPGIFPEGWRLPGMDDDDRGHFFGTSGRVASAAVPRLETISGWYVARHQPKAALRAVPAGSVYWLDDFRGSPEALAKLQHEGLPLGAPARRAAHSGSFIDGLPQKSNFYCHPGRAGGFPGLV